MKIKDAMTEDVTLLAPDSTLQDAALRMGELDCGFLPVHDGEANRLIGVITDRDVVIRAVAQGCDPKATKIDSLITDKVLYCYAEDSLEEASASMRDQGVYRLIVLDNSENKQLCGIISLGDVLRHGETGLAASAAEAITSKAA
ncbi:MAG: CBS domain-containing protein [Gammaproteobacteria bacterium]|nr:CBS domain-containing protein [Pseudomonadales bacterium]MCP5348617.1 CBS domain-containing protein [Pseudomonadales bacterium]